MVKNIHDVQSEIISESVRRLVRQVEEEIDNGIIKLPLDCPISERGGLEQMKRLLAMNIAMVRIIESVESN